MKKILLTATLALTALGLSACQQQPCYQGGYDDDRYEEYDD